MPLERCEKNGVNGWRWGEKGVCYTGSDAKAQAIKQGLAIGGGELKTARLRKRAGLRGAGKR